MDGQKALGKSCEMSKQEVWDGGLRVEANKGAAGVGGESVEDFEADLKGNLYKIWNRMSSGSYFPPPVKAVEIPKAHSVGTRILGVPTVADRIAQTVAAARLEENVEPKFHDDSYGYRPGRSALHAAGKCRERCWRPAWVIDLDIRKLFDSLPCDLTVQAADVNTSRPCAIPYGQPVVPATPPGPAGPPAEPEEGGEAGESGGGGRGGGQEGCPGEEQGRGAVLAAAHAHDPHGERPGAVDQPGHPGLDELLRGVLQDRAVSSPPAHQRLPDALAAEEIQAAPGLQ